MVTKRASTRSSPSRARSPAKSVRPAGPLGVAEVPAKLTDLAYQQIEEAIVTLRLPPGTAVSEQSLSDMTGIGRTPIREAVQRLAHEHLIVVLPQRGILVSEIDLSKQLKLLETRREVERLVCRSAAKRATEEERRHFLRLADDFLAAANNNDDRAFMNSDREFNELCLIAARNEFAEGAMNLMHGLSRRFWYLHYKQSADLPVTARLHAAVAAAIGAGDVAGAGKALDDLLDSIDQFVRATVL